MCLAPFYHALDLSLLLGPVQNHNLHSRGLLYAIRLAHSVSLALYKQENTLDIALDTFRSLVSISKVCYTNPPNPSDFKGPTNTCDRILLTIIAL